MEKKISVGVLASGNGTDLQSIIDASENNKISAKVVVVISDNKDAFALKRAEKHNIKGIFLDSKGLTKNKFDDKIDKILLEYNVDLVIGAGYMRMLTSSFVERWYGKLINIHPTLLPSFKGKNGQGDAINYGVKISGCTTHFVDRKMDHGPIILQAAVKIYPEDDREELSTRILSIEHQILPRTIQLFAQNRLKIFGRKVKILSGDSWLNKYDNNPDVLFSDGY
jgi:phosphoribosylglycinamide formyltransferase-1